MMRPATAALAFLLTAAPLCADDALPRLDTNERYVQEALKQTTLELASPRKVFQFVLDSLPGEVTVYPTENYYYFSFRAGHVDYAGNIRFDAETRDTGVVHFTYFKAFTDWQRDMSEETAILGAKDGVTVTKVADLVYKVEAGGRTVTFKLNDLRGVKPPEDVLRTGERYLGPVFDESGIRFFLVFAEAEKVFLYILDETVPVADELAPSTVSDRLTIGTRTGFAFYRDRFSPRRILVGVNQLNTSLNNYLDGPFDQLPDNFLEGDELLRAILEQSPHLAGTLDRFGNSEDDKVRYLIAPYMQYERESDLMAIVDCADHEALPLYDQCFSYAGGYGDGPPPEDGEGDGDVGSGQGGTSGAAAGGKAE